MPTVDIIGYLWSKRQALGLDGIPDALQMASDLQRAGLEAVRVEDQTVFGVPTGVAVTLVRRDPVAWDDLVSNAIVSAAAQDFMAQHGGDGR
jgi:hypothetical protein